MRYSPGEARGRFAGLYPFARKHARELLSELEAIADEYGVSGE